jgi:hypothetical protein
MAEQAPQNFSNHVKTDPPFHFVLLPTLLLTLILSVTNVFRHYESLSSWILVLLTITGFLAAFKTRLYALKAQDRVIRLEERLRLQAVLSDPLRSRIGDLSESQLVAIRFASDGEVVGVVEKALSGNMKNADIKKSIKNWRADHFRI